MQECPSGDRRGGDGAQAGNACGLGQALRHYLGQPQGGEHGYKAAGAEWVRLMRMRVTGRKVDLALVVSPANPNAEPANGHVPWECIGSSKLTFAEQAIYLVAGKGTPPLGAALPLACTEGFEVVR